MSGKYFRPRILGLLIGLVGMALVAACGGDEATPTTQATATSAAQATATSPAPTSPAPAAKEVIRFHDGQWGSLWVHNAVARYIVENGYGYPTEEIQGTTGTMLVTLIEGDIDVNMEIWRMNLPAWYNEHTASGVLVDLAGYTDPEESLPAGAKGQVIAFSGQGFYVPRYVIEGDPDRGIEPLAPDLKSVLDLPDYWELFKDPNDPSKGAVFNCIIGWECQKINRAKWYAYGLYDTYNVVEPGGGAALKAAVVGPYEAGEPFLSYYWEPTDVVNTRDLVLLEEPERTEACIAALDAAMAAGEPYESEIGCAFASGDVHTGVHKSLVERAPEVTEFLANLYMGASVLAELEQWKGENDVEWRDVGVKFLKENRDMWTSWITDANAQEIIARVDAELALE
ncbi:MAG: ABC transporter substrate-binding protein [Chloroflexi bacterium]|nr:ABC transporter substrate-binding protein [Chloroflexota bacterium]